MHFERGETGGLLNESRQINILVLDIKKDFIEQNDHLLCNWDPCDCNQMKIFRGKGFIFIAISDFRDASAWLENVFNAFVCGALSSDNRMDNRMVCFHRKAFLTSDNAAGLTRS